MSNESIGFSICSFWNFARKNTLWEIRWDSQELGDILESFFVIGFVAWFQLHFGITFLPKSRWQHHNTPLTQQDIYLPIISDLVAVCSRVTLTKSPSSPWSHCKRQCFLSLCEEEHRGCLPIHSLWQQACRAQCMVTAEHAGVNSAAELALVKLTFPRRKQGGFRFSMVVSSLFVMIFYQLWLWRCLTHTIYTVNRSIVLEPTTVAECHVLVIHWFLL